MRFDDNEFDAAVSTLALDVIPEIEQVVAEMKRVTRPGGVVASAVTQFFGGMPAFDLVYNTGAVLENDVARMRSMRAGRTQFWPNGQAALWRKIGLADVTEVPVVVDCEYQSFADYWATFTDGPGSVTGMLMALSDEARGSIEQHVRAGYLVGLPDSIGQADIVLGERGRCGSRLHEIVELGLLDALAEVAGVGKRCIIVVIHQEKRTAFQTRASALAE
jgi:SAM-dependent methyltransferase